jgi:YidC/Oxa1 family membrane protein insertase
MKKQTIRKIIILTVSVFMLTGCTKTLKDNDNNIVTNPTTGQSLTENIICQPTDEKTIEQYENNNIDISSLPKCSQFSPLNNYEGLWTSIFVKPLAWVILKIGTLVKSYGLSIILTCLIIRLILMPITKKTAMQSENMKQAQPEIEKIQKKYSGRDSQEAQTMQAQELMLVYQKYHINPISGCLLSFVQLPLLLAFLESINRTPAIFEENFLSFQMGTTPLVGIFTDHNFWYILLIALIMLTTYFSFRKTLKDQSGATGQAAQMKYTIYFMLVFILIASFSLPAAIGIYWITSSLFTIFQNKLVERKKKDK